MPRFGTDCFFVGLAAGLATLSVVLGQPLPPCGAPVVIYTSVGQQVQGSISGPANVSCPLWAFALAPQLGNSTTSNLKVNLQGAYIYYAPANQITESFNVTVSCGSAPQCNQQVLTSVANVLTYAPTPAPTSPTSSAPPIECPHVYWYSVAQNSTLSASLRNVADQLPCASGLSYTLTRNPNAQIGSLFFTPIGDFRYTSLVTVNAWDDFGFTMNCQGAVVCDGTAYIMISNAIATAAPVVGPPSYNYPGTGSGSGSSSTVYTPVPGMTCTGSCVGNAWPANPQNPGGQWDTANPRIQASWVNGGLVIKAYSQIGTLGERFPTFENVLVSAGQLFTGFEQLQSISQTSVPFNLNCLNLQAATGMAANVWYITSLQNLTGQLGPMYDSGNSWYQKFGGKHVNCDTFLADACQYAPLLTPVSNPNPNLGGVWTVSINGCAVTWTGVFSFAALRAMRRGNGTPVWSMVQLHNMETTIASEAVQPLSWFLPSAGVATNISSRMMVLELVPTVTVSTDPSYNNVFSVDAEYFEYNTLSGDRAFGLNVLFYPQLDALVTIPYSPDRHVIGWKWSQVQWTHPDQFQCPTCTGTDTVCTMSDNSYDTFTSNTLYGGNCLNPVVQLSKGPMYTIDDCVANPMHVFNQAGFSAPQFCRPTFQNLTLRGVAPGSAASLNLTGSFSFEGQIQLSLLFDNGAQPTVNINLGIIVGFASTEGDFNGVASVCRSGEYFPVLDPLGTSTPDNPFPLSMQSPVELCTDPIDQTFGPQGWALMTYRVYTDAGNVPYNLVQPQSIFVTYPGGPNIYLLRTSSNNIPITTLPPSENAVWWNVQYPFFCFRDLSSRLPNQTFPVAAGVPAITGQDYAFIFMPGALGLYTQLTVTVVLRILPTNPSGSVSHVTFTQVLSLNPSLTVANRFGLPMVSTPAPGATSNNSHSSILAMVALGLLIMGLGTAFAIEVADDNNPIVGGLTKTMSALQKPLLLPIHVLSFGANTMRSVSGVGPKKPVVKRATKQGIPVTTQV